MTDPSGPPAAAPAAGTEALEAGLREQVSVDLGWRLIQRFSSLVRESGTEDEREAAEAIVGALDRVGVEHEVYEPELYLSRPRDGRVELRSGGGAGGGPVFRAKPPSFSRSTGPEGRTAPVVHVPGARLDGGVSDIFAGGPGDAAPDVAGKIVLTEGYAMPLRVRRFEASGAVGQIYINPGENIHWGICTPIWGTPTDRDLSSKPSTPVVAVSRPDGRRLAERAGEGSTEVTIHADLEEGWFRCKLPVATVRGRSDDFVLVHGHYDSWDVGIGDNAVGDATLLELARIFDTRRGELRRTLKVAWWPGHSTGRYAGSTWYADRFALELRKRCVAAVNIDSPGCWRATAYEDVMWMAEADALCRSAIVDATGKEATRARPLRAGDYSFHQVGITAFFMLLSSIPAEERERLGFYPVGGCGGNIAWHTEDDTLEVADRENLERDLRVYVTALARVLHAEILPLDHRAAVREMEEALDGYRAEAAGRLDLAPVTEELEGLRGALDRFYRGLEAGEVPAEAANRTLRELSRILVPLAYAEGERFEHDPALPRQVLPKLADIARLGAVAEEDPERLPFLRTRLRRRVNQVANGLWEAAEVARRPLR